MPEPNDTPGQVPNSDGGQVPAGQQPTAGIASQQGQAPEPEKFDAEYVKKLRDEAAETRRKLRDAESKLKEHSDAQLTETERLKKEAQEAKAEAESARTRAQEALTRARVTTDAARLGIVDPDAAYLLLNRSRIQYDENGDPTNVDSLLKDLLKAKPYLGGVASSATNPGRQRGTGTDTDDDRRARLFGGGGRAIFDPNAASERGGGVIWHKE